jgi:hypothetical protein
MGGCHENVMMVNYICLLFEFKLIPNCEVVETSIAEFYASYAFMQYQCAKQVAIAVMFPTCVFRRMETPA